MPGHAPASLLTNSRRKTDEILSPTPSTAHVRLSMLPSSQLPPPIDSPLPGCMRPVCMLPVRDILISSCSILFCTCRGWSRTACDALSFFQCGTYGLLAVINQSELKRMRHLEITTLLLLCKHLICKARRRLAVVSNVFGQRRHICALNYVRIYWNQRGVALQSRDDQSGAEC